MTSELSASNCGSFSLVGTSVGAPAGDSTDPVSTTRGLVGTWDIGAYEYTLPTTDITTAGVTGFTAPATGGTPQAFGALTAGSAQYTVTGLTWSPTDNPFHAATAYTATVVLTSAASLQVPDRRHSRADCERRRNS